MKRSLRTSAALAAAAVLFSSSGTMPSVASASEAKGFRGGIVDDLGKRVTGAKVQVNFRPVEVDPQGRFFVPHEKLKYDRTVFVTVETMFENQERNPPYRWEVNYARVFDYATGEETVTVRPRIPGALAGRVLAEDGKPLAGAKVSAHIAVGLLNCHGTQLIREPVQTDAQGRFRILRLYADNDYLLRVEVAGYERKWTRWIHLRSGDSEPAEIRLRTAPAFVAGKVVDASGHPVAKARVVLGHLCIPDAVAQTDAEGNFRIESLLPDQEVSLWANGTVLKTKAGMGDLRIVTTPQR